MLPLTEKLLKAAGFKHDEIEDTWMAPVRPRPVATIECDEEGSHIMESLLEAHAVLEACGCTYRNFSINGRYVSVVGLTRAWVAAVA